MKYAAVKVALILTACTTLSCGSMGAIPATDSAAAATAMATGRKTEAGNICWRAGDPPEGALQNLGELLGGNGWAVGLVSTVPFCHATPACFAAHSPDRNRYYLGLDGSGTSGISEEMIGAGYLSLIVGAGHPGWNNPDWKTDRGYISHGSFRLLEEGAAGWRFCQRLRGKDGARLLAAAVRGMDPDRDQRVFGLFGGEAGCFEPPEPTDDGSGLVLPATEENPTLGEAAVASLDFLSRDDQGFFLLLEQGDIDWACHHNDYSWMIGAMWDLDRTVASVMEYIDTSTVLNAGNTLVVVTSDHANGYLRLFGRQPPAPGELPEEGSVSWGCDVHTNEPVTLAAAGPERALDLLRSLEGSPPAPAATGFLDNTHIYDALAGCASLDEPVPHLVLVIGDGMSPQVERAAGIYLHGEPRSLAWQDSTLFPYRALCTTWDVDTYNRYARWLGRRSYTEDGIDPALGYDVERGGRAPGEGDRDYYLTPLPVGSSCGE